MEVTSQEGLAPYAEALRSGVKRGHSYKRLVVMLRRDQRPEKRDQQNHPKARKRKAGCLDHSQVHERAYLGGHIYISDRTSYIASPGEKPTGAALCNISTYA